MNMAKLFRRRRQAQWIIYNYGDEAFELAECSRCGNEELRYIGVTECPNCHAQMVSAILADEITEDDDNAR